MDSTTGLIKFGIRYYNPNLGRWTWQDLVGGSVGSSDSLNRYLYAGDDPINQVDPSGKDCFINLLIHLIGGVIAAITTAGYFGAILAAANSGAELTTIAFLFSVTGPSVFFSILLAVVSSLLHTILLRQYCSARVSHDLKGVLRNKQSCMLLRDLSSAPIQGHLYSKMRTQPAGLFVTRDENMELEASIWS